AVFKGLLFLGAGAVLHGAGTGELDRLGGLLKRMPWTGAAFLVGAVAICGLPPLNGFVSEFLIYLAAFRGVVSPSAAVVVAGLSGQAGQALIGGLAAACFTKAFGVVFLGEPRTERAATAHEAGPAMRWPMAALACLCGAIGVFSPAVLPLLAPAVAVVMKDTPEAATAGVAAAATPLTWIVAAAAVLALLVAALSALRFRLLGARARHAVTWDCGYAAPTPRMQYTASSFAQPLTDLFAPLLRTRREHVPPKGIFPAGTAFSTETDDLFQRNLYAPLFRMTGAALAWFRWAQQGRVQLYVLYIALTLLALLLFCFE
ncbi:MAG TPA: proton-conducting transporter membrane subunit, partial [Candidatus Hydrogenedentes bacterium]|nr:proton-conducting transporter membrane subunit [Candidatus Hydrogenedentota bacterium]